MHELLPADDSPSRALLLCCYSVCSCIHPIRCEQRQPAAAGQRRISVRVGERARTGKGQRRTAAYPQHNSKLCSGRYMIWHREAHAQSLQARRVA